METVNCKKEISDLASQSLDRDGIDNSVPIPRKAKPCIYCGNCGRLGHQLGTCLGPLKKGHLTGCPYHNTSKHDVDECRDQRLGRGENNKRLHYVVKLRNGLPPLRCKTLHWSKNTPFNDLIFPRISLCIFRNRFISQICIGAMRCLETFN